MDNDDKKKYKRRRKNTVEKVTCKYHPNAILIDDDHVGDQICSECGLIVCDRAVDTSAEWRTFNDEPITETRSRVGRAESDLLDDAMNLSTLVALPTKKILIKPYLPDPDSMKLIKLHVRQSAKSSDRTLLATYKETGNLGERLHLSPIIQENSNTIIKKIRDIQMSKGRASKSVIAATCLYIACRQANVPRTLNEICEASEMNKTDVGRFYKLVMKKLKFKLPILNPGDYIPRFCSFLGLAYKTEQAAKEIAKNVIDMELVPGKSPLSVCGAAIYLASQASDIKRTIHEVAEVVGTVDVTIRACYRILLPHASILFPPDFQFQVPILMLPGNYI